MKKQKQKEFTFRFFKTFPFWSQKTDPEFAKATFKQKLLQEGYLVRNLKTRKILMVSCLAASAKKGISFNERVKLQNLADKAPDTD